MNIAEWIGSIGVGLLLAAFVLQMFQLIDRMGYLYIGLNFVGAALAGISSYLIDFYPFVILEGTWALVSLAGLINKLRSRG